ncbi:MAG: hypothetical protein ISR44_06440 [Rhodospirillales bacterium]|nr:hypothetical protein [Alphaproteobacteria bacterium]MBL6928795.1 hypothetical protein [Rhodospirillales bacterium]
MTIILILVVLPLVTEFVIKYAEEQGFYDQPSQRVADMLGLLGALTGNWWFAIVLGFVAGGTLFMWVDVLLRKITIIRPNIPTSIKMQFQAGSTNAVQLSNENIVSSHFERQEFNFAGENGELLDQRVLWVCVLVFTKPTHYGQIIVDAGNARIPEYQVLTQKHNCAIVRFNGDIGNVALEIKCIPSNPA